MMNARLCKQRYILALLFDQKDRLLFQKMFETSSLLSQAIPSRLLQKVVLP